MSRPKKATDEEIFAATYRAMTRLGPGDLTLAEIAKTMGVAPQQLYPIARRLSDGGQVTRKGDGFHVANA